ncbi:permease [Gemmatirosa kalamazoonensis]|uniref:Permease n=1 Tax=Gemmatirosa kalamazoonensis TaxID=861299 RepID=W0RCH7_9BACT|nr:ABC transporter permease [Gemmatirosa kalamazoonensis]AHG88496.1 permease [Gemmatirosa kalamazoonensis]
MSARVYRVLLALLLPARFRRRFGDEMALVFAELCAASRGPLGGLRALAAELPPLLSLALRERRAEWRSTDRGDSTMTDRARQDLRFAWRALRRSPGFALVAALTLALGVGANTAIFSVVRGVLLKPLALRAPEQLVDVAESRGGPNDLAETTPGSFADWRRQAASLRLAGYSTADATLTGLGDAERLPGAITVGGLFELLGVPALVGRALTEADDAPGAAPVVVLSHAEWQRLFGGDRAAMGRALVLDGTAYTIVGVMPPSFRFPSGGTAYWMPARFSAEMRANRDQYFVAVVGRLRPGATLETARAELATIAARQRRAWPQYDADLRIVARPLLDTVVAGARTRLLVLMASVGCVLLITCANLGNLLLARATARRREFAVRRAVGAGTRRLVRQLFTESLLLALVGGALGAVVGRAFLALLLAARATTHLPRADEIRLDLPVLAFTLGVSALAGLCFGSVPAWQLARTRSLEALRQGTRGSAGREWTRRALVVSELALAMMLLTGAGLLLRSFAQLQRVDPGFAATRLLTFDAARGDVRADNAAFFAAALERVRALPGVRAAALVSQLPVTGRGIGAWFNRLDRPTPPGRKPEGEAYRVVSPEYFTTIGLPLRRGRSLGTSDTRDRPAVVINEALARKYYPGEDPIGKEIYLGAPDNRLFDRAPIVGVVGDTHDAGLGAAPLPTVYIPHAVMRAWPSFSFVVRTAGAPETAASAARAAIRALDPSVPVRDVRAIDDVLSESVAPARWSMMLMTVFAAVALTVAALGVFGVLSFLVAQRRRELGIRMALGAAPRALRRMVLGQGLVLVLAGLGLGVVGALALSRFMTTLLYGVTPTDAATYAGVAVLLVLIAVVASWLPARHATHVDPIVVLRSD